MKAKIMAHLVAWYPDEERSLSAAKALIDGGAACLEVQFPFSDPSADGLIIQKACSSALNAGFTVKNGFNFIRKIKKYSDIPVFIMSYGSIVYSKGIYNFTLEAKQTGAAGLIIPDLTPGYDEGLFLAGEKEGLCIVPVVAPTITESRLKIITELSPDYIYAALRTGITGENTKLDTNNLSFLNRLKRTNSKVLAGFGIKEKAQIKILAPHIHAAVVGSEFVKTVSACSKENSELIYIKLKSKIESLAS